MRCQSTLGFNQCASELGERYGVPHDSARRFCGSSKPPLLIYIYIYRLFLHSRVPIPHRSNTSPCLQILRLKKSATKCPSTPKNLSF